MNCLNAELLLNNNKKKLFFSFVLIFLKTCSQTGVKIQKICINKKGVSGHAEYFFTLLCDEKNLFLSICN